MRRPALDCLVYAWAARQLVAVNLDDRASSLEGVPPTRPAPSVRSPFVDAWFYTLEEEVLLPGPILREPPDLLLTTPESLEQCGIRGGDGRVEVPV